MRLMLIALVLCAVASLATADSFLRTKARLFGKLSRHHKRGLLPGVPTYKVGHDIPRVTHSVVKPFVVTYPPASTVATVKVPLLNPLVPRFPGGHHFGHKFPHTKTVVLPKPTDSHFHHHHHHLAPRPVVPVHPAPVPVPVTPVVPVPEPTAPVARPVPAPPPFLVQPTPLLPAHPIPVGPPPTPVIPFPRPQLTPLFPAAAIPLRPAPILPPPTVPLAPQLQYVIRPGNAIQTSYFATYPRYPLANYQPLYPVAAPPVAPAARPVLFERPQIPHFHVAPNAVIHQSPAVQVEPTPTLVHETHVAQPAVHLHPTQSVAIDHNGWAPVQTHDVHEAHHFAQDAHGHIAPEAHAQFVPEAHTHFSQDAQGHFAQDAHGHFAEDAHGHFDQDAQGHFAQDAHGHFAQDAHGHFAQDAHGHFAQDAHGHFAQDAHTHFTQEQGNQVYEHHTGDDQTYQDLQHQLQHHIQQQLEQAQFEQNLNNHQLNQEYGPPHQVGQEHGQPNGDFSQNHGQDFYYQQPGPEYGAPGVQGRSSNEEEGEELKYHNHIPLGLQLPLDRPLEHFR